jgi:hypothetical protein
LFAILPVTTFLEFYPFGLFVKDLATRSVFARCNTFGPLYTLRLPTLTTYTPNVSYTLVAAASSST